MTSLFLFSIAVIKILQVHSEIFGSRSDGDYLLSYRMETKIPEALYDTLQYPRPNQPDRPETITWLNFTRVNFPDHTFPFVYGGVGEKNFQIGLLAGHSTFIIYTYGEPLTETLTTGSLNTQDSLLHTETIIKKAVPNMILVVNLKNPKISNPEATITWMSILDETQNDPGSIRVNQGGVGFRGTKIRMNSRIGGELKFKVQIYGNNFTADNWPWYVGSNAATEARLFKTYWPWFGSSVAGKKNCGCKTGRLMVASPRT